MTTACWPWHGKTLATAKECEYFLHLHDFIITIASCIISHTHICRSNFHGPTSDVLHRRVRGHADKVLRSAPTMFVEYNRYMGGTDLCDQRRGQYTTQRRSKKWWHSLFYFTLDILMVCTHTHAHTHTHHACMQLNSWAVYNWENDSTMSQKDFIISAAKGLLVESDPYCAMFGEASVSPDLLSPAAKATPPLHRFAVCRKPFRASIAASRNYKYVGCLLVPTHTPEHTHMHDNICTSNHTQDSPEQL